MASPSGVDVTCLAGPGTRVRATTEPRRTSTVTTSPRAESVTYARVPARGGVARLAEPLEHLPHAARSGIDERDAAVCGVRDERRLADGLDAARPWEGRGSGLTTRGRSRSTTATCESRSAVTNASGDPCLERRRSPVGETEPERGGCSRQQERTPVHALTTRSTGAEVPDLSEHRTRISGMDLQARFRRTLGTECARVVTSAPACAARSEDRPPTSRPSSGCTGPEHTAPHTSSRTMPRPSEDIAQESFLAAIRALDRFDRRRPFGPWLQPDRGQPRDRLDTGTPSAVRGRAHRIGLAAAASIPSLADDVVAALERLSPEHRAVIVMRYLLEFTPGEIAEALDLPRGTVNSRLRRGLDSLSDSSPTCGGRAVKTRARAGRDPRRARRPGPRVGGRRSGVRRAPAGRAQTASSAACDRARGSRSRSWPPR